MHPRQPEPLSGLNAYEHAVLARSAAVADEQAMICEGRQVYFAAIRKVSESYAEAVLEQMAFALIHEAKAAA